MRPAVPLVPSEEILDGLIPDMIAELRHRAECQKCHDFSHEGGCSESQLTEIVAVLDRLVVQP